MFNIFKKKELPKKGDFIIIFHFWFVHDLGWDKIVLSDCTYDDAKLLAVAYTEERKDKMVHCSYKIIEVRFDNS